MFVCYQEVARGSKVSQVEEESEGWYRLRTVARDWSSDEEKPALPAVGPTPLTVCVCVLHIPLSTCAELWQEKEEERRRESQERGELSRSEC